MHDRDTINMEAYTKYLEERREVEEQYFMNKPLVIDSRLDTVVTDTRPSKYPYWYMATIYTNYPGGLDKAHEDACKMMALCLENGIYVFAPIPHTHTASKLMNLDLFNHDFWMQLDYCMLTPAVGLIVVKMDNWERSKGISLEIDYMTKLGKPIVYTNFMEVPNLG